MRTKEYLSFIMNLTFVKTPSPENKVKYEELNAFCKKHVDKAKLNIVRPISKSITYLKDMVGIQVYDAVY